jgi:hypothetical protein
MPTTDRAPARVTPKDDTVQARQLAAAITSGIVAQQRQAAEAGAGISGSLELAVEYDGKQYGVSVAPPSETTGYAWEAVIQIGGSIYVLIVRPPADDETDEEPYWMIDLRRQGEQNALLAFAFVNGLNWYAEAGLPGPVRLTDTISIETLHVAFQRGHVPGN